MKFKLKLFATLRNGRFCENEFEVEYSPDVNFLLEKLELKQEDVPIVFINGRHADYTTTLKDGDEIAFFPPVGGG